MKTTNLLMLACLIVAVQSSCKDKTTGEQAAPGSAAEQQGQAKTSVSPQAMAQAKEIYAQRCTLCHGANGQGDGPASASLQPRPRNYADPAWQASVTDVYLQKVILEGGAAVGKSMMMPGNEDLRDKPEVIQGLVQVVRSFRP